MPFAAKWMLKPKDYHTKSSKSDKDKSYDITHMWNLIFFKKDTNEPIYKTEADLIDIKNKLMVT